ncbi:uncharacterized protein [Branchiostoma lanceolatum]|uniref:CPNE5 protein n=1 Tax=Branchiostoma lanceolatum TaxID=7740 RepID=A0A8J9YKH1_BRALA|nr:CPNE5 [Branchiostoma lanceolatum]
MNVLYVVDVSESCVSMLSLVLFIGAFTVMMVLFHHYKPKTEKELEEERRRAKGRRDSLCAAFELLRADMSHFDAIEDKFSNYEQVTKAMKAAGLVSCNLIVGVDFTASNEWQGRRTFGGKCLHALSGKKIYNPYQKVISTIGQTLQPLDEDNQIPVFGFGDSVTRDKDVFPFRPDGSPCQGHEQVLNYYGAIVKAITLSGPTSFAPLIYKAIEIVKQQKGYHILLIIADGQVKDEGPTRDAIVEASNFALSIIMVGVGDGPWGVMKEFDDRLPERKFDNFQFVDYHTAVKRTRYPSAAFALHCLMEVPDQYKAISRLGYLNCNHVDAG